MTRIIDASCLAGVVSVDGTPTTLVDVMTQGNRASEGIVILDKNNAKYLTTNAEDIADALEKIADALGTIASSLTSIGAGMTGSTTAPPPGLGANVTAINLVATQLDAMRINLK
jgi:hypothetical protein